MSTQLSLFAPVRVCANPKCDAEITGNPRKKYCGRRCNYMTHNALKRDEELARKASLPPRFCANDRCGVVITGNPKKVACSNRCQEAARRALKRDEEMKRLASLPPRLCSNGCGVEVAGRIDKKWCSAMCRNSGHKEVNPGYQARWRAANPGHASRWHAENVDVSKARKRAYYRSNRDQFMVRNLRRRLREACAVPQHWIKRDDVPETVCYWCGTEDDGTHHLDHLMPIALGGNNAATNLHLACQSCNLSKSAKHPLRWIAELIEAQ